MQQLPETEQVVISGIGGSFPNSNNIQEFQKYLYSNEDILQGRWDDGKYGLNNRIGKIKDIHCFDSIFFKTGLDQGKSMEAMHRLALERTYEALLDAGVNPLELKGKRIGCYMGASIAENAHLSIAPIAQGYGITGSCACMLSNRISFWLDIRGPSLTINCNWMNGIEVIRLGCEAINNGHCDSVIVGTSGLVLNSELQYHFNDMGVLSQKGVTRPFDANADGYARSDGIVVLYLQKSSQARRSYATILKVSTLYNGDQTEKEDDVNKDNMENFISNFYSTSKVKPNKVEYVEAYGCGIKDIDKKELDALEKVYCNIERDQPLLVGSVKSNTGHSEASASLFGIVKVLIAMENEEIPATINFKTPNPEIKSLQNGNIKVVSKNQKWTPKYAAVNALGMTSYYGHILLKANEKTKSLVAEDQVPRLITLSSRNAEGMQRILETIKNLTADPEFVNLTHTFFETPITLHTYRGFGILGTDKYSFQQFAGNKRPIWFVYSGMGSQWNGMVGDLMGISVFANAINKCHEILLSKNVNLKEILTSNDPETFNNILNCFVGIAAIQIALTDVLKAVEIAPDGIIGHSVGELGCAYADGCLTAKEMILAAYYRGRASLEANLEQGMMAAVGMSYNKIKTKIPPTIEVACHNSVQSCTISGPVKDMEEFVEKLKNSGTFARLVNVGNIAYHSRYIKPAAPILLNYLKKVVKIPIPRSSKWISTSNKEENWQTDLAKYSSAEYHTNNLLSSVLFEEGLKHVPKNAILIEIAPHGLLQAILKRSQTDTCLNVDLAQRGSLNSTKYLLEAIGKLYIAGLNIKVSNLYPNVEYPVSRGTYFLSNLATWEHSHSFSMVYDSNVKSSYVKEVKVCLGNTNYQNLQCLQINNKTFLPCSFFLNFIIEGLLDTANLKKIVFEDVHIATPISVSKTKTVLLVFMIQRTGKFNILSNEKQIISGTIKFPSAEENIINDCKVSKEKCEYLLNKDEIYSEFLGRHYNYPKCYKTLKSLEINKSYSVASLAPDNNQWVSLFEAMVQQHLFKDGETDQKSYFPKFFTRIAIDLSLLNSHKQKIVSSIYDFNTNSITIDGLQIFGVNAAEVEKKCPVSVNSLEVLPITKSVFPDFESGLSAALVLVIENLFEKYNSKIQVTEIISEISKNATSLLNSIRKCLKSYSTLTVKTNSIKDVKSINLNLNYALLLISNNICDEELINTIRNIPNSFLLVQQTNFSHFEISEIFNFVVNKVNYSLLHKSNTKATNSAVIKLKIPNILDLTDNSETLLKELRRADPKKQVVFLLSTVKANPKNVYRLAHELSKTAPPATRLIFNFDAENNEKAVNAAIHLNLKTTIIRNGNFEVVLPLSSIYKKEEEVSSLINNKNIKISFIGVNLKEEAVSKSVESELGIVDWCGTDGSGQKLMGLGQFDKNSNEIVLDPVLKWKLPENMLLQDAATLPYVFSSAYYCLLIKAKLNQNDSILVNSGCSALGMAMISIACKFNCNIFTTVSNTNQKHVLLEHFDTLKDSNIFYFEDINLLQPSIMELTEGKGVRIVTSTGNRRLLEESIHCVSHFGKIIHIGKTALKNNTIIGTNIFLQNTSFTVVSLENIINCSGELKNQLKKLIENDLVVDVYAKSIPSSIFTKKNANFALQKLGDSSNIGKVLIQVDSNKLNVKRYNSKFVCKKSSSYLVYGGSSEKWLKVVEWLVYRGARSILVCPEKSDIDILTKRRIDILNSQFNIKLLFSELKAINANNANKLVEEVNALGSIHAVFALSYKEHFQNIENFLRNNKSNNIFVNLITNSTHSCENFSYNVQWQKETDFHEVLSSLDEILKKNIHDSVIRSNQIVEKVDESAEFFESKLNLLLPASIDDLLEETEISPTIPEFKKLTTLYCSDELRGLDPIFIIPSVGNQNRFENVLLPLLYPTYSATLPSTPIHIKELAKGLVKKMKKIWPKKVYNIVAIFGGGPLSIEISRILDKEGASLHLYFIDSAPETVQSTLTHLGKNEHNREVNLLVKFFNITKLQNINRLESAVSWDEKVNIVLEMYENKRFEKKKIESSLYVLKSHLEDLYIFKPNEHLLSGKVYLFRSSGFSELNTCGLTMYCKNTPEVTAIIADQYNVFKDKTIVDYINEHHYVV